MKKLLLMIIAFILIMFTTVLFIVNNNNSYNKKMIKNINKHYHHDITYVNKYGNNYIVKTKDKIVVLDESYKEELSENIKEVKELDYELVYRKNTIMYQKSKVKGKNIIYTYYDIKSGEEIDKLEIEG